VAHGYGAGFVPDFLVEHQALIKALMYPWDIVIHMVFGALLIVVARALHAGLIARSRGIVRTRHPSV
jgi:hypothetical protein